MLVEYQAHDNVALIALNNPPVNALSIAVRQALAGAIKKAEQDPAIEAIVLTGRGRCFCGGADIREFAGSRREPFLAQLANQLEASGKPVIAAVHGAAAGGGCELALGCHYRLADTSARFALPEVRLGLLPGAGGTQRLPRVIGVGPALECILSGNYAGADEGKVLGFFDEIVSGDLAPGAIAFAKGLIKQGKGPRPVRDMKISAENAEQVFSVARAKAAKRARGLIAPERCISAVEFALTGALDDGMALERKYFDELVQSDQSKAQRHLFFAEREAHKIPGVPADTPIRPIGTAAVIGCGTMGRGIAMSLANGGIPVCVLERDSEALEKGLNAIRETYAGSVSRGSLAQGDADTRLELISGTTGYKDIADADIVIEAVFEEMELKKQIFSRLGETCKPGAILATNTSTLDVDEIAAATDRPGDVIGTHFFSPANVMRLMENVRGKQSAADVIATVMKLSRDIGKVGVVVGVCDGFAGNRMLYAYKRQAEFLLEEGALPHQVDKVIADFGFPMGPFAMSDLAGLDVGYLVRQHRRKTSPPAGRTSVIADRIVESGRHGQKTNSGWYRYEKGSRTPIADPEIEKLIVGVSEEIGIKRRGITNQEILERCLYPLINEGAKILQEGIAARPGDIDLVWVYGYGYPPGKGGPMFYADQVGAKAIYDAMCKLHDAHGDMLAPAPLLEELAKTGKSFAGFGQ
ncbi:MAG: 3-hydroxyacyl-CoA dehydrogenase NAD-binding domain-containing protein [Methyloligellaceae bacterium]